MHLTLHRVGLVLPRYRVHAHYNRNFSTVAMATYWRREAERRFTEAVDALKADGEDVVDLRQ